jgi:hypothetical protein
MVVRGTEEFAFQSGMGRARNVFTDPLAGLLPRIRRLTMMAAEPRMYSLPLHPPLGYIEDFCSWFVLID